MLLLDGRFEAVLLICGAGEDSSVCFDEFLLSVNPISWYQSCEAYPEFDIAGSVTAPLRRLARGGCSVGDGCGRVSATFCLFDLLELDCGIGSVDVWMGLVSDRAGAFRFLDEVED